jgi:hypothetical protein
MIAPPPADGALDDLTVHIATGRRLAALLTAMDLSEEGLRRISATVDACQLIIALPGSGVEQSTLLADTLSERADGAVRCLRLEVAHTAIDEAGGLYMTRPDGGEDRLLVLHRHLIDLSVAREAAGDPVGAAGVAADAVVVARRRDDVGVVGARQGLAEALDEHARLTNDLRRSDQAIDSAREATDLWWDLARNQPTAYLDSLTRSLITLSTYMSDDGRHRLVGRDLRDAFDRLRSGEDQIQRAGEVMAALSALDFPRRAPTDKR